MKPRVAVLFTSGTNCDNETSLAVSLAGGSPKLIHTSELARVKIEEFEMVIIPGGFSYGDHLGSATVWSNELKAILGDKIGKFLDKEKLILGICNGFQILVKLGVLPNSKGNFKTDSTLADNASGRFESRWVRLLFNSKSPCVFTKNLNFLELPSAHGEGNFLPGDIKVFNAMIKNEQIVAQYVSEDRKPTMDYPSNPNGSFASIAGICDPTGRALGMMPHPERFLFPEQSFVKQPVNGLSIYKNAIEFLK